MEELISLIQSGRHDLMEQLWMQLRRLIEWYAKRYYRRIGGITGTAPGGVELDDLIQAGYIALADAVNDYDPSKGTFTPYLSYHLQRVFRLTIGRTDKQLSDPLNYAASLDVPNDEDDPDSLTKLDGLPDPCNAYLTVEDRIFQEELHSALEKAIDILSEQEARAIRAEYYEGQKQKETAEELGVSISRVSQLRKDGIRHLRQSSAKKQLEIFLGEQVSYYKGNGLGRYIQTMTSGVERAVLHREYLRDHYIDFLEDEEKDSAG